MDKIKGGNRMFFHFCTEHRADPRFGVARIAAWTIGGMVMAALFALLFGWLVQALWNWLMPGLFSLKAITYWQAFGIVILAKILFGGVAQHHPGRHYRHWMRHHKRWKDWNGGDDWKTDDVWMPRGSYRNWKYYDQYWREEGKSAFEAYIDRIEKERKPT
jgi:hypothetical protein